MAELITAADLRVGDVFTDPRRLPRATGSALFRVQKIRVYTHTDVPMLIVNYDVVGGSARVDATFAASLDLVRVQPVESYLESLRKVVGMADTDQLTFYTAEGRLWA